MPKKRCKDCKTMLHGVCETCGHACFCYSEMFVFGIVKAEEPDPKASASWQTQDFEFVCGCKGTKLVYDPFEVHWTGMDNRACTAEPKHSKRWEELGWTTSRR